MRAGGMQQSLWCGVQGAPLAPPTPRAQLGPGTDRRPKKSPVQVGPHVVSLSLGRGSYPT